MALDPIDAKRATIRAIVKLDESAGPHLRAPLIDVARHVKAVLGCNLARALQAVVRLQRDPAFQRDAHDTHTQVDTLGINLLDRDCVPDPRVREHLMRLVKITIRRHVTGQFFIPSHARARFYLNTKVRKNDAAKVDWYLDHDARIGKPIRSFAELHRDLA